MSGSPGAIGALNQGQIVVRVLDCVPRQPVPQLEINRLHLPRVEQLVGQAVAALEADALPRRHQVLLLPITQHRGAREHIDELILLAVVMLERRDGARRQGRQVNPEIRKTEVLPQFAPGTVFD